MQYKIYLNKINNNEEKENEKIIALLLVAIMCLSFVACGNNAEKENTGNNAETNNTQVDKNQAIIGEWSATSINATAFFMKMGLVN